MVREGAGGGSVEITTNFQKVAGGTMDLSDSDLGLKFFFLEVGGVEGATEQTVTPPPLSA